MNRNHRDYRDYYSAATRHWLPKCSPDVTYLEYEFLSRAAPAPIH